MSGSNASAIPEGAITGFATTGFLLRENVLSLDLPETEPAVPPKRRQRHTGESKGRTRANGRTKSTKMSSKGELAGENIKRSLGKDTGDGIATAERMSRIVRDGNGDHVAETSLNQAPARTPVKNARRQDIPMGESDASLRSRTTRRKSGEDVDLAEVPASVNAPEMQEQHSGNAYAKLKSTGKSSKHFATKGPALSEGTNKLESGEDLNLERAIKRRTEWTPVKNTKPVLPVGDADKSTSPLTSASSLSLSSVLLKFEYSRPAGAQTPSKEALGVAGEVLTKRRRIEVRMVPSALRSELTCRTAAC